MKNDFDRIQAAVEERLAKRFPGFPAKAVQSQDDPYVICAEVYAVPTELAGEVEEFIRSFREELEGEDHYILPMVVTLEATRRYYPELLPPRTGDETFLAMALFGSNRRSKLHGACRRV
ncbi:MAG: hypothetical protein WC789_07190 [Lentisphaeria bacterium]|jgi:hypothetical protein